jgi:hypothetical protein
MDTETVLLSPAKRVEAENQKLFEAMADGWLRNIPRNELVQAARRHVELDILETVKKPGFSLKAATKQLREAHRLQEEITQSQVYALTTGLITLDMANKYKTIATCYRALAEILPSSKSEESYFARQRGNIPQPLADNEEAPSSGMGGVLTRIKNYRFAEWIEYSKTLEDDDQTGTIRSFATDTAGKMSYAEALWWVRQFYTVYQVANTRASGGIVPNECVAGQASSGYGGPTCTPGAVSRDNISNLWTAADYVTDLEGDFMLVQVTAGHFANSDKFTVKTIMTAEFNPNTPSASADVVGGTFAPNVLKGEFEMYFDQFIKYINSTALSGSGSINRWSLGEAGTFGAFQEREALSVTMESPNAGKSLGANQRRYLVQRRFGAGVPHPEFVLVGN